MNSQAYGASRDEMLSELMSLLSQLNTTQLEVVRAVIGRFSDRVYGQQLLDDFLHGTAYDFFGVRLQAHHAYSTNVLKKENFEHILEQSFLRTGVPVQRQNSMTVRGADLMVGNVRLSLKTEAAKGLRSGAITISKLMEAAWIKQITSTDDIPGYIQSMVLPHFSNYDRIFILRSYGDTENQGFVRYDLHEIPVGLLYGIGNLTAADFSPLTKTRTTSAAVFSGNVEAFRFRLDGSDDKLTITNLQIGLCPLHAWWSLRAPD